MSPFVFAIFSQVTKNSGKKKKHVLAIALRGRKPRLSAFAHYMINVLLYGEAKTAVFKRLSKLGITATYSNGEQKEIARTCGLGLHL